jgi:hypothetical protein
MKSRRRGNSGNVHARGLAGLEFKLLEGTSNNDDFVVGDFAAVA